MLARWVRRFLWLAGFACLWINVCDDPPLSSGGMVVDATAESVTVGVIAATAVTATAMLVDSREAVVARQTAPRAARRHEFVFAGLSPGTSYGFVIELEDGRVERGSVRTAPVADDAPVKFAFLGDSGDQPWWVWLQRTPALHLPARWGWFADAVEVTRIAGAVAAFEPDFSLHLGDVVYPRGQHALYRSGFFRPFDAVLRRATVLSVPGNHDVLDARGLQLLANLRPRASGRIGDGRNFSWAWGSVRVIGLDCSTELTRARFAPGHPSHAFLLRELAACTEPWIVVVTHYPIRSGSRHRDSAELLLHLMPELIRDQVSLYLSGHDHCYQRFNASRGEPPMVVSGGGGKELYEVGPHRRSSKQFSAFHWCSADVQGTAMRVRAVGIDGRVLDEFALTLPSGAALDELRRTRPERARRIAALAQ